MKLGVAQINLGVGNLDFYFDKLLAAVNNLITQNAESSHCLNWHLPASLPKIF